MVGGLKEAIGPSLEPIPNLDSDAAFDGIQGRPMLGKRDCIPAVAKFVQVYTFSSKHPMTTCTSEHQAVGLSSNLCHLLFRPFVLPEPLPYDLVLHPNPFPVLRKPISPDQGSSPVALQYALSTLQLLTYSAVADIPAVWVLLHILAEHHLKATVPYKDSDLRDVMDF